jgi:raffinose/stachyose/melibiose transport system permease protein
MGGGIEMNVKLRGKLLKKADFLAFVLPAFVFVLCVSLIPFVMNLYYSLFDWNGVSRSMRFVGIGNFVRIFTMDNGFHASFAFTAQFSFFYVILVNVLSVFIALFLARKGIFSSVARSCFYIPGIVSLIVISFVWRFILGPGFDALYEMTGMPFLRLSWIGDSRLVFWTILLICIWQNVGFYMVIYIAGIMGIPKELLEAAEIDGSYGFSRFVHVTLPLIMPSVTVNVFASLTFSFKLFDIILVFTGGGPGTSSNTIAYNIYKQAFANQRYGMATAKSVIFFLTVMIITTIQLRVFKKKEIEQ